MAPGRKRQPAGSVETEYEKQRAANIMRNNKMLQSLGVTALATLVSSSHGKSKGRASEQPRLNASDRNNEQYMADKVLGEDVDIDLTRNTFNPAGSKRVMALDEQDAPARRTRQRTRAAEEVVEGTSAQDDMRTADCAVELDDMFEMGNEVQSNTVVHRSSRGRTMGKDLDRISRGLCTKIPVHVAEGMRRPEAPMQAAKLASETGIVMRQHIPVLPHWKDYKKEDNMTHIQNYLGKLSAQFFINKDDKAVINACTDMLKCAQRQQRYRLKKRYFDGVAANEVPTTSPVPTMSDEQWRALVAMWSSAKHKEKCSANKMNREKVQFHQRTGSRSFIAHAHVLKHDAKYKDIELTAIDLFKECHNSSKTGLTESVKEALAQMEAIVNEPPQEGQSSKTPIEAVAEVLPSSSFLRNVGLETRVPKINNKVRVQQLEAQVLAERQGAEALREHFEALNQKVMESEAAREKERQQMEEARKKEQEAMEEERKKQHEEMEELKKQFEATNAVLRRAFGFNKE